MNERLRFSNYHTQICLVTWTVSVLWACYQFTKNSQKYFEHHYDHHGDFTNGWSVLGAPPKDNADFDWKSIKYFIPTLYPYLICYTILTEVTFSLIKTTEVKVKKLWIITMGLLFLSVHWGPRATVLIITQPLLFYALNLTSPLYLWIGNLTCLGLINILKYLTDADVLLKLKLDYFQFYFLIIMLCWNNLKCISYYLSCPKRDFLDLFAYVLYLPMLFTGPFINFESFKPVLHNKTVDLNTRLKQLGVNLLRLCVWVCFLDITLHYVYVNAAGFQLEFISSLPMNSLCGYGYLMGQFFHIKYLIFYGLSTSLASFEGATVPRLPRCIGRVHLYSDMWKHFDPGLYNFLKECLYIPALKSGLPKVVCVFLTFAFVYVWHGLQMFILIWASLNFLGVLIEQLCHYLFRLYLSKVDFDVRLLKCVLAAPLMAMSAISNFYFFAGKNIGDVFLYRALTEDIWKQVLLLGALYCCCQVSEEIRDMEARRM